MVRESDAGCASLKDDDEWAIHQEVCRNTRVTIDDVNPSAEATWDNWPDDFQVVGA